MKEKAIPFMLESNSCNVICPVLQMAPHSAQTSMFTALTKHVRHFYIGNYA